MNMNFMTQKTNIDSARFFYRAVGLSFVFVLFANLAFAQEKEAPKYLGSFACRDCHEYDDRPTKKILYKESLKFIKLNEYDIWHELDPHAKAYKNLTSPLGQQMGKILGIDPRIQGSKTRLSKNGAFHLASVVLASVVFVIRNLLMV